MKITLILAIVIFLLGCRSADRVRPFIPGTYYASWRTPFSIAVDTIHIAAVPGAGFVITRRTHLEFTNAAKQRPAEYTICKWQAEYNSVEQTLIVRSTGRVMYFDPDSRTLRSGTTRYQKL